MKKLITFSAIIVSILFFSVIYSCSQSDTCGNTIEKEVYSTNRLKRAVVFERDCGATTGFSTQVSILDGREKLPNEGGNTLRSADILHFGPGHDMYWRNENELVIEYNFKADIRFKANIVNGVNVIYKDSMLAETKKGS